VPWLMLGATLLLLVRTVPVRRRDTNRRQRPFLTPAFWPVAIGVTFVVALYGGYFGAGIGILMISALSLMGFDDIRGVIALKNFLAGGLRGVAVMVLVIEGVVNWGYGLPMALGRLIGGYLGGTLSHHANRSIVRWIVIGIGFSVSVYYFWRLYGPRELLIGGE
jgi:uncharacterized protein